MRPLDPQPYINGVLAGDRRVLAKTITLVESNRTEHQKAAGAILDALLPHTGKAVRLGITGVPGVGKSTFIESFGMMLAEGGRRLAVLAVDPSGTRSGGSIMADKTRMERLAVAPNAFIRPSPSGGSLGGVARKTRETLLVCEAAGFDVVLVETVGVGQSETAVASMVDFFLVLMLTGAGDELQGIKKGVLELADAVVVNKADGDNVKKAEKARQAYEAALHLLAPATPSWSPPVMMSSGLTGEGLEAIWQVVLEHRRIFMETDEFEIKRRHQSLDWMWALIEEGLRMRFHRHPAVQAAIAEVGRQVECGETTPTVAAVKLLFLLPFRATGRGDGGPKGPRTSSTGKRSRARRIPRRSARRKLHFFRRLQPDEHDPGAFCPGRGELLRSRGEPPGGECADAGVGRRLLHHPLHRGRVSCRGEAGRSLGRGQGLHRRGRRGHGEGRPSPFHQRQPHRGRLPPGTRPDH
jgi:LAO/AO transport system kinase